ncbi:MAG: MlaD family protein [Hyphomicrobiaceae bacterium]
METRANTLIVGIFALALLGGALLFARWTVDQGMGGGGTTHRVLFTGSVAGLSPGANVLFNGIKVGAVETISIYPKDTRKVEVALHLKPGVPVRSSSQASITQVGITGLSAIQISAGEPNTPLLPEANGGAPIDIAAKPQLPGSIMDAMPEILNNVNSLFVRLNQLVDSNEKVLSKSMESMRDFTDVLAKNKDAIGGTLANMHEITESFRTSAARLDAMMAKIDKSMLSGDSSVVIQATKAMKALRETAEKLDKAVGGNAEQLATVARRSLQEFELLARDGRRTAQSIDRLVVRFERDPKSIIWGDTTVREYKPN